MHKDCPADCAALVAPAFYVRKKNRRSPAANNANEYIVSQACQVGFIWNGSVKHEFFVTME
jgi:hypothetical protein